MNTGGSSDAGGATTGWTISSNKKYLVDRQGNPLLLQGEAAWEIIQGLSEADAIAYLDDRKSRGVNALIVELIEHKFTAHTPRSANVAGHVPFANNNDFTTTHDDYFNDAERFIQQALSRGFLLFMTPSYIGYGCGDEGWCAEMKANGVAKLTQYGRYVGQKFRNYPNIVWVEGGDHTPSTTGNPSEMDLVNAVANGVIAGDGGTHLHTAHWEDGTSSADVPNLAWLSLDAMYWHAGLHLYTKTLADWTRDKGIRPSFLIETWYENEHQVSRIQLRAQMYEPLLSGSTGFFVGNDPIWFFGNTGRFESRMDLWRRRLPGGLEVRARQPSSSGRCSRGADLSIDRLGNSGARRRAQHRDRRRDRRFRSLRALGEQCQQQSRRRVLHRQRERDARHVEVPRADESIVARSHLRNHHANCGRALREHGQQGVHAAGQQLLWRG